MLKQVSIRNIRNIRAADLEMSPRLTIISGDNGAGKSSLLEALYLLSRAATFRTRHLSTLITAGELQCSVKGSLSSHVSLMIHYHRSQGAERFSGLTPITLREATQVLPTLALTTDSLQLLSGPPSDRRSFLDWLVFHVKHAFHQHWGHYRACLSQRNAVLRKPGRDAAEHAHVWSVQMEASALAIHQLRSEVVEGLAKSFDSSYGGLFSPYLDSVRVSYSPGWNTDQNWLELQAANFAADSRRGRTEHGPHRADLKVLVGERLASDVLSRGQQKALVMRLYLALLDQFKMATERSALILVDDITAELDEANAQFIAVELVKANHQVVATILGDDPFRQLTGSDSKMFHVKHGTLTELS